MANSGKRKRKQARVLIVDDSALVRHALVSSFALMPWLEVVGQAKNGLEALEAIRESKPDVVTLDIRMPKMNGLEVLKAIKTRQLSCTTIVLSVIPDEIYRKKCFEAGANYVFDKATEFEAVLNLLRRL
jgi:YesN/AraC family two-component response regulator